MVNGKGTLSGAQVELGCEEKYLPTCASHFTALTAHETNPTAATATSSSDLPSKEPAMAVDNGNVDYDDDDVRSASTTIITDTTTTTSTSPSSSTSSDPLLTPPPKQARSTVINNDNSPLPMSCS